MRLVAGLAEIDELDATLDRLDEIAAATQCTVQAFDARYVTGPDHLQRALRLADRAFERDENVARERGVELLLYAAGRRQIDDALEMGLDTGTTPAVVCVAADPSGETPESGDTTTNAGAGRETADTREERAADRVADLLADTRRVGPDGTSVTTDPERVRAFFDIGDRELAATDGSLADLVAERVALLDVRK